jgi:cytochrome c-type biogenesis protein CcmH
MIIFWIIIIILLLVAAGFVLWPLRRPIVVSDISHAEINVALHKQRIAEIKKELEQGLLNEEQFTKAMHEAERGLLQDVDSKEQQSSTAKTSTTVITIVLVAIVLLASGLYWHLGDHHYLSEKTKYGHVLGKHQQQLRDHLKTKPGDAEAWARLGRLHVLLGQFPQAVSAYEKAHALLGDSSAQVLVDYAEAVGRLQKNSLIGKPEQLVQKALKVEPNNITALMLAGFARFQQRDYKRALHYWYKLKSLKPGPNASIDGFVAQAESATGRKRPVLAQAPGLKVVVALHKSIRSKVSANDFVFIYAQASTGPRMPIAMVRKRASDLPITVLLGDAQAIPGMPPAIRLSRFPKVVLKARVSRTGQAVMQPGDYYGSSKVVSNKHSKPVIIFIRQLFR